MSKGIGKLQRDILAHLHAPTVNRRGRPTDGWTTVYGTKVVLAEDVYDLRNVKFQVWREVYKPAPSTWRKQSPLRTLHSQSGLPLHHLFLAGSALAGQTLRA